MCGQGCQGTIHVLSARGGEERQFVGTTALPEDDLLDDFGQHVSN
jgi:hypothetical protein